MMRYVSSARIGLLILCCINLWLLAVIVTDAMFDGQTPADTLEWKPNLSDSLERTNSQKPIDAYKQILARPLFYKTREPFVSPPAPPPIKVFPSAAVSDPGFVLAGVIITNEIKKAFIFSKTNPSGVWANEGDSFMGWTIRSVDGASVTLEQVGRVIEVQLYPPN